MQDPALLGSISQSLLDTFSALSPTMAQLRALSAIDPRTGLTQYGAGLKANTLNYDRSQAALAADAAARGMFGVSNVMEQGSAQNLANRDVAAQRLYNEVGPGAVAELQRQIADQNAVLNMNLYNALLQAQQNAYAGYPGWEGYGVA
jgi:hypothetical protein